MDWLEIGESFLLGLVLLLGILKLFTRIWL